MFTTRTPPHRVAAAALCFTLSAMGTTAFAADPPKAEEVPFWAVGKPKADDGALYRISRRGK